MANSLWSKDTPPTTIYALVSTHEMRTYTNVGSLSAVVGQGMRPGTELHIFDVVAVYSKQEVDEIYRSIPNGTKKRSERIAETLRFKVLLSALKRGGINE